MAVPKKKTTKGRRNRRRSHHALKPTPTTRCPHCETDKLPHRVCPECGKYEKK